MSITNNNLTGKLPNLELNITNYPLIDLSSNQLEGSIPSFLLQAGALHLSNNKFSDIDSFLCSKSKAQPLVLLDLSDNQLTGELPDCWNNLTSLQFVDLSDNNLSGNIPFSMAALVNMKAIIILIIILRNNSLSGKLTSSLIGGDKLALLDFGENKFYGPLPSWIGDNLHRLVILSGFLACVKNFTSMTQDTRSLTTSTHHLYKINLTGGGFYMDSYDFDLYLMWKGVDQRYKNVDKFLKSIDLSSNHLTGKMPTEMEYLIGLVALNLSRNNLTGEIISKIGNFKSLEFLDLSRNHLSGKIPSTLAHIDRLTMLDLSYNQLYGKIPIGTQLQSFNALSFEGNSNLCGEPHDIKCPDEEPPKHQVQPTDEGDDSSIFLEALFMIMGIGFFTGLVGFVGSILFLPSWR
ncbi:unnamed protein product [Trifolium pratense]|uniref:Uncharacterized protein n=1 Tax=Trifolium pratense TaxID=57577 RepID=A0ACB0LLE3_TRIPR|nr:unnamed protein product [Trifolium pratense]